MTICCICHDDCTVQAVYINGRTYCTPCAQAVPSQCTVSPPVFGAELRKLRQWVGISSQVLAGRMHLKQWQLDAFESDKADAAVKEDIRQALRALLGNGTL